MLFWGRVGSLRASPSSHVVLQPIRQTNATQTFSSFVGAHIPVDFFGKSLVLSGLMCPPSWIFFTHPNFAPSAGFFLPISDEFIGHCLMPSVFGRHILLVTDVEKSAFHPLKRKEHEEISLRIALGHH